MIFRFILLALVSYLLTNHYLGMVYSSKSFSGLLQVAAIGIGAGLSSLAMYIDRSFNFPYFWTALFVMECVFGSRLIIKELNR